MQINEMKEDFLLISLSNGVISNNLV